MAIQPLLLRPGVEVQKTPLLAGEEKLGQAAWVACNQIRFDHNSGQIQKLGGWAQLIAQTLVGTCRGMISWDDFSANNYLALGTEQRLTVYSYGQFFDITPVASTDNLTAPYTTTNLSTSVQVTDGSASPNVGDWINILNPIYVNGILLQGLYQVTVAGNPYTITAQTAATASGTGGTAAQFVTVSTSTTITVNLQNHGLSVGSTYTVLVPTTVGGVTLSGSYTVYAVNSSNQFTFIQGTAATSSTSGYENGGNSRVEYLISTGLVSTISATGYGQNAYNLGPYGYGASTGSEQRARCWYFGKWGEDIVANFTGDSIYFWDVTQGLSNNPATLITQAPTPIAAGIFVASEQQMIIAMAAGPTPGTGDPMLVRWCDVADFTDWTATAINQAGSFRLQRGSRIMGGLPVPNQNLIWTDTTLYVMQYLGAPYVWGFSPVGQNCGLIAPRAAGVLGETVMWMSQSNFFAYEGSAPTVMKCTVWDQIFGNINTTQYDKILAAANTYANEMLWFYPSLSGNTGEVDSYVKVQKDLGAWDYGFLSRTAWVDQTAFGPPMGVDLTGLIQQHEISPDANGTAMVSYAQTAWFKISEGDLYLFMERMLPNFKSLVGNPTLQFTVYTQEYGDNGETTTYAYGPFTVTPTTKYFIVRARGMIASLKVQSSDLGTQWRLGDILYHVSPAGKRL